MPSHPVRIEFAGMPPSEVLDASARRRMRGIEAAHHSVLSWSARIEAPPPGGQEDRFAAVVRAHVSGGRTLSGDAHGHDALAALRLAFNALELHLEADQASARARAAAWLAAVRSRMRGWPE
ncbi:HPF/RaiA family ribosome-associated protein [Ramlibacter alkalitolerans]|jgi:hypothetical protein|uniref:HPF/RaiA family ribosome-associated protein n=1 Tax=Ramlibacter alkalitolerans TaxID=2039631 RepID=A0ABS1JIN5_9BURK|nr:HPF/RaiA family ribosome-associated protein [Ramlibacter alkalitolerans]MBL0423966.1 HPF/RaiA family ribosome-associated protein [Ramlibacter alkalitolerans]